MAVFLAGPYQNSDFSIPQGFKKGDKWHYFAVDAVGKMALIPLADVAVGKINYYIRHVLFQDIFNGILAVYACFVMLTHVMAFKAVKTFYCFDGEFISGKADNLYIAPD